MATSQRFCLRWNNHQSNLLSVFDQLLHDEAFVDVTLAVEGQFLRAHKMVLSACSPYFQSLFVGHPDRHPIVILKDVPYADMRSLLDFMYRGEVSVDQERLTAFLKVAESLRIKGLTEVNEERCDLPSIASSLLSTPPNAPPPPNLHRIHPLSHKRVLPPMAANPLLGSALTAPKRKRGRPRKLSGSSNGPNTPGEEDNADQEMRLHHPNRADSPAMVGPPDLLEVNMGESDPLQNDESGLEADDTDGKLDNSEAEEVEEKPIKQEPTPGTSSHDSSFKGNNSQDGDSFNPDEEMKSVNKSNLETRDEPFQQTSDVDECYEDMIACSPASSDFDQESNTSKNGKTKGGKKKEGLSETDEFLDEDISQYEFDSFKSMMSMGGGVGVVAGAPGKPMDKASVRRYCTHEADNAYRCNVCGKTYTHISNFCRHFLSTHHGMRPEIPCPVCFKLFTRKDNMMTHTKQVHRLTLHRGTLQPIFEPSSDGFPPSPFPEPI
uniref:BTB domain-containing protein n=1 Tax=Graphocephala atropunctata TaxID=36148 RepID=A0A1B6LWX6_9HEMI